MRRITIAVLAVFIFSLIANYKFLISMTTLAAGVISLSVEPNPQGVITSFSSPSSISIGNPANFSVEFKNVGNTNITETIIIFIKSSDLQTSTILRDNTFTLGMGEKRTFTVTYTPNSSGTFFAFVVVTYDNKTAEANASFVVPSPPTLVAAQPTAGGGIAPVTTEIKLVQMITPEKPSVIKIKEVDKLKLQEIKIETKEAVENAQITIKEAVLPPKVEVPIKPDQGSVLKYVEVTKTNIEDYQISNVKIKFKVEKSWISSNSIDSDTVKLQRYESNLWKGLPTTKLNEDATNVYYETESPGLSLFAITGEKRILTLEYPKQLKLNRGQSALINVFVKNDGNVDVNNLILIASVDGLSLDINPDSLAVLPPSSSFVFLISVKVPDGASSGTYPVQFTLASEKIIKKGTINVEVETLKIETEVSESIKNYDSTISSLYLEATRASKEGRDVEIAVGLLDRAKIELDIVKEYYDTKDYTTAKERLEIVRNLIEDATVELAKTARPKIVFVPFPRPEIIVPVAGAFLTSAFYYYRQKKEKEKYRKSIRKAIQIIKNKEE